MKTPYSIFIVALIISCKEPKASNIVNNNKHENIDSTSSKRSSIISFSIKNSFPNQRIEQIDIVKDTLKILSANSFFYYPFGKYTTVESFLKSNPLWKINQKKIVDSSINLSLFKLLYHNSRLSIIRSADTKLVEMVDVSITDQDIVLSNGIHVGMSKNNFFKLFFRNVNADDMKAISTVKVTSALDGIWNEYYFKSAILNSISFKTDYTFNNQ